MDDDAYEMETVEMEESPLSLLRITSTGYGGIEFKRDRATEVFSNGGIYHPDQSPICIGRNPQNDIVFGGLAMSGNHGRITYSPVDGEWRFKNLSSSTGTLDKRTGEKISARVKVIKDGDEFSCGPRDAWFTFNLISIVEARL